jgi:hypothetical protein
MKLIHEHFFMYCNSVQFYHLTSSTELHKKTTPAYAGVAWGKVKKGNRISSGEHYPWHAD